MLEKIKRHQRTLLAGLIAVCITVLIAGGFRYFTKLQSHLTNTILRDVMNVTLQQRQAFDNFISKDRERLHSYAEYFSHSPNITKEEFHEQLKMFNAVDSVFAVICLKDGWYCSNAFDTVLQVDQDGLEELRALSGCGFRDNYAGLFAGVPRFSYYEAFTFADGHSGLIQKSYDRSIVLEAFPLSFYNGEGFGYILNGRGDILLRSADRGLAGENVFDALAADGCAQADIDGFRAALAARETGSAVFTGGQGSFVYTYVPVESADDWSLLSVIPMDAIREDADQMMMDTRISLTFLVLMLLLCAVFILLIRRTSKDIASRDKEVEYQTQLFHIVIDYLSSSTDDVYLILDHQTGEVEYVSPNAERVLGVRPKELIGFLAKDDEAEDPEAAALYYREVVALTPGQAAKPRNTERVNPKTGERRYFKERAYCADVRGRSKRICYLSDRTKERVTQDTLSEALRMAQAANDAKSAFLSNMSHDIRTPMNAIIGFLSLMRNEAEDPDAVREYVQRVDAASQHLMGLINDILDMNKIESGSTSLTIDELSMAELIDELNAIIRPQTRAKDQTFNIFVSHLDHEHLMGDKMRLNQIFINLLSNAVKYTPEGGTITMRVEQQPQVMDNYSRIRFTVQDNGLGMSEEYQKIIFDPFTREDSKVIRTIQGTGLGMAITKSLVDLMGGSIHVESALNQGSTFTVELELRIPDEDIQAGDGSFWEDHKVVRMIVADDDEEICRNIVKAMAKTGVQTDYATDGGTALRMMRENREAGRPYDLILLDWQMPTLDGLETARLIRKNYPDKIPILLLTAYDWSEIEQEAVEIGVNHFMPKPFFMSSFKDAIRRVMGGRKSAEEEQSDVVRDRHVLVVDDIDVNRMILVKILTTLGAVCDTAGDGREAVDKFEASQPGGYDLILMDVQMPVMDGYEATKAIRNSAHPDAGTIPIIAMTANAFVDDVRDALESGMDAHVSKPVQMDKLRAAIRQVLDQRREGAEV